MVSRSAYSMELLTLLSALFCGLVLAFFMAVLAYLEDPLLIVQASLLVAVSVGLTTAYFFVTSQGILTRRYRHLTLGTMCVGMVPQLIAFTAMADLCLQGMTYAK